MADYNSVPLGQAGTGAAFVLGEDTASTNFLRNLERQKLLAAQQQQLAAQKMARSYQDNALAAADGKLFAKELGDIEAKHIEQGMQYRGQGWDIYNPDPNDKKQVEAATQYAQDRRRIEALRGYRKGIETDFINKNKLIQADPLKYNQNDISALNSVPSQRSLQEMFDRNESLPNVGETFNVSEALKGIKAMTEEKKRTVNGEILESVSINRPEAENMVISAIANSAGGQAELQRITGGEPIEDIKRMPATLEGIKKQILTDSQGDPEMKKALAEANVMPNTPAFNQWADQEANRLYGIKKGYDDLINRGVSQISSGIKVEDKRTPEMDEYQKQSLALRRQSEARIAAGEGTKEDNDFLYRQDLVERMLGGVAGSGEEVNAILKAKFGDEATGLKYDFHNGDEKITIKVPERFTTYMNAAGQEVSKTIPKYDVTVNRKTPEGRVKLNQLLNDLTGTKISNDKFQTGQASGKIKGSTVSQRTENKAKQSKTISGATVDALYGKKGYEGYSKKELRDYYTSQGYTIK